MIHVFSHFGQAYRVPDEANLEFAWELAAEHFECHKSELQYHPELDDTPAELDPDTEYENARDLGYRIDI